MSDCSYLFVMSNRINGLPMLQLQTELETPATRDSGLLVAMIVAVESAAARLSARFDPDSRPADAEAILAALAANDEDSLAVLSPALRRARPISIWSEDASDEAALAAGEWWVTDAAEGNINHIHGMPDWGVSATLVRDGVAALTAVTLPMQGKTYSAIRGGGAFVGGTRLRVSVKTDLRTALVGTGQASHGDGPELHRRLSLSCAAMLERALLLRVAVPSTLQLIEVAAGRADAFWQFTGSRAALLCGALLVTEAGGVVTDPGGGPWVPTGAGILAAAPGLHAEAVAALAGSVGDRLVA